MEVFEGHLSTFSLLPHLVFSAEAILGQRISLSLNRGKPRLQVLDLSLVICLLCLEL